MNANAEGRRTAVATGVTTSLTAASHEHGALLNGLLRRGNNASELRRGGSKMAFRTRPENTNTYINAAIYRNGYWCYTFNDPL